MKMLRKSADLRELGLHLIPMGTTASEMHLEKERISSVFVLKVSAYN